MPTRAATFFPTFVNQDFTAPGEDTILKLGETGVSPANTTTRIVFGDNATDECAWRPFLSTASNAGTGPSNNGWAINRDGTDGMGTPDVPDGFQASERFIAAGTWTITATTLIPAGTTLGTFALRAYLYRVSATGTRTLLHTVGPSTAAIPLAVAQETVLTAALPEITFGIDETLHVGFTAQKTNTGLLTGATYQLQSGATPAGTRIGMPAGIRTRYTGTFELDATGDATIPSRQIAKTPTVLDGVGDAAMDRTFTGARLFVLDGVADAALDGKTITKVPMTMDAVGDLTPHTVFADIPIDDIPDSDGDTFIFPVFS